jgi:hypothetical protein
MIGEREMAVPSHHSVIQEHQALPQTGNGAELYRNTVVSSSELVTKSVPMKSPSPLLTDKEDDTKTLVLPFQSSSSQWRPFPVKEFCVHEDTKKADDDNSVATKHDASADASVGCSSGDLLDSRVTAIKRYKAQSPNELSLKKGQIVKQKLVNSEEGLAYGWTRRTWLSRKRYGWYPLSVVARK